MPAILTTEKFIQKAIAKHGTKFDYSRTQYINAVTKVEIVCPEHGPFWQLPNNHLKGLCNCPACTSSTRATPHFDTAEFKVRATEKHAGFYNYDRVIYSGFNDKVEIICPTHGPFWQRANNHLAGTGCNKCAIETKRKASLKSYNYDVDGVKLTPSGILAKNASSLIYSIILK